MTIIFSTEGFGFVYEITLNMLPGKDVMDNEVTIRK